MLEDKKSKNFGENFDFTKPIKIEEKNSVAKILLEKMEKVSQKQWIMTGIIFTVFIFAINIPNAIAKYSINVKALELQEKMQLEKLKSNNELLELKIEKEKEALAIKKLKEISSSDMQNIISFIRKTQAMENSRLDELALKIKFVDERSPESEYKVGEAYKEILQNRTYVTDYYNQMLNAMLITYKEASQGKFSDIETKYDDKNIVNLLEEWNTNVKINAMPSLLSIDELIESWEPEFTDTKGIQAYLQKNKK